MTHRARSLGIVCALLLFTLIVPALAAGPGATPDGTMTWAVHVTLAPRWLDPADTESAITPFMVLYPLHDALVKLMPGGMQPSLAESWTMSADVSATSSSCARVCGSTTAIP